MKQKEFLRNWLFEFSVPTEVQETALLMLDKAEWVENHQNWITSYGSLQTHPEFAVVGRWIEKALCEVKTELNAQCDCLALTQLWGNKTERGQSHHLHTHMNSWLHGVMHLSPSDSSILFTAPSIWAPPSGSPLMDVLRGDFNDLQDEYRTTPGKMLVFPSSLAHMVTPHGLEKPRYSIGFNAFPSGILGDPECLRSSSIMEIHPKTIFQ